MHFPENFLWGAATSGHQVEGGNANNDWWQWESEGKVKEPSGRACGHYDLFREDFKLAGQLNHNAHRFSIEWSRIEPGEGSFDAGAIDHYREVIAELRKLKIEPVVTLHHFTIPRWFYKKGGWVGEGNEYLFARYVKKIVGELGRDVKYWITLNEPAVNTYMAFIEGSWPPGRRSFREAARVFVGFLKAHCLAYKAIHGTYKEKNWGRPNVSIAKHFIQLSPCRETSFLDRLSTKIRHYYFNTLFIRSVIAGWCVAPGLALIKLPAKNALDFIGVNYYTRDFVHYAGLIPPRIFGDVCTLKHHRPAGKRNFLDWEIYPRGLRGALKEYSRYGLPLLITENGTCTDNDEERVEFLKGHLEELSRAITEGANVIGYLHWSLLDNFEWAHGFGPRFGLVEADRATGKRSPKPSAYVFSELMGFGANETSP